VLFAHAFSISTSGQHSFVLRASEAPGVGTENSSVCPRKEMSFDRRVLVVVVMVALTAVF
jgi:hypothetical protein